MPSLEHLVQHYMRFSDGLPINLRYPVPPKPKPPLPLFSTIPKSKANRIQFFANSPGSSAINYTDTVERNERKLSMENFPVTKRTQRNLSIPSDDLMNQVGILSTSPNSVVPLSVNTSPNNVDNQTSPSTSSKKSPGKSTSDILNFRSLKLRSPKKMITIDGMKSLRKSKATKDGNKTKVKENTTEMDVNKMQTNEDISQSLKNLTFSADFKASDILYNVPTNNCAINTEDIQNHNVRQPTFNNDTANGVTNIDELFIQSDKLCNQHDEESHDKDNSVEEIYFVDAPTKTIPIPSTSFNYVAFKQIPYFPDGTLLNGQDAVNNNTGNNIDGNTQINANIRADRIQSTISTTSTDSEFMLAFPNSNDSTNILKQNGLQQNQRPNYYIPKSSIILNEVLGEGEFGSVYKGVMKCEVQNTSIYEPNEIPVAVKTLHDEHCKENRAEFLREASVMIKLSHHCIVRLIGISKVEFKLLYFVV